MKNKPQKEEAPPFSDALLSALSTLMKEVGLLGFLLLTVTYVFLFHGTDEQKKEFIDKFILFKDVDKSPFPFGIVVAVLVLANVIQHYFYTVRLKMSEQENKRIGNEKSELQEKLLGKRLRSSEQKKTQTTKK